MKREDRGGRNQDKRKGEAVEVEDRLSRDYVADALITRGKKPVRLVTFSGQICEGLFHSLETTAGWVAVDIGSSDPEVPSLVHIRIDRIEAIR